MIDVRQWLISQLETITPNVLATQPEGKQELPLVIYAEIANVTDELNVDRLGLQVTCYDNSFEGVISLSDQIDELFIGLGFRRTYLSPDTQARVDKDLYQKVMSYTVRVNTVTKNIYKYSTDT